MSIIQKISPGKLMPVFANGLYMLLPGLINQLLAFFVIAFAGSSQWGEIVQLQLYYYLVTAIIAWGNKEYLLVHFSKQPGQLSSLWQQSIISRGCMLLVPVLLVTCFVYPVQFSIHLCCWIAMRYVTQSVESIVVFRKRYAAVLVSELAAFLPLLLLAVYRHRLTAQDALLILSLGQVSRAAVLVYAYSGLLKGMRWADAGLRKLLDAAPFMLLGLAGFLQARSDLYCIGLLQGKNVTGNYQVLMSYVSLCLLVPGFLVAPYTADLYQLAGSSLRALQRKISFGGVILGATGIAAVYVMMTFVYGLRFDPVVYVLAVFYVISPYFYLFRIYEMYRKEAQSRVMAISFGGILVNTVVCVLLIPAWGITGALTANCISQLFLFVFYRLNRYGVR